MKAKVALSNRFFDIADKDQNGDVNIRELISMIRKNKELADFVGASQKITESSNSGAKGRDFVVKLFSELDSDGDRHISRGEWNKFFAKSEIVEPTIKNAKSDFASPRYAFVLFITLFHYFTPGARFVAEAAQQPGTTDQLKLRKLLIRQQLTPKLLHSGWI